MLRLSAVAGRFYPSNPAELTALIRKCTVADAQNSPIPVRACLVPHAENNNFPGHRNPREYRTGYLSRIDVTGMRHKAGSYRNGWIASIRGSVLVNERF